jgi:hypothetical protein
MIPCTKPNLAGGGPDPGAYAPLTAFVCHQGHLLQGWAFIEQQAGEKMLQEI